MRDLGRNDRADAQASLKGRDAAEQSLGDAYEAAWDEWVEGDGAVWDVTVGDGLSPEDWSSEQNRDTDKGV